jgi:hypothetical protein
MTEYNDSKYVVSAEQWDNDSPEPQMKIVTSDGGVIQIPNKAYISEVFKQLDKMSNTGTPLVRSMSKEELDALR